MKFERKLLLLLFGSIVSILVIFSVVIYYFISRYSYEDFYKRLEIRAITTAKVRFDKTGTDTEAIRELRSEYLERLRNERHYFIEMGNPTDWKAAAERTGFPVSFLREIARKKIANFNHGSTFVTGIRYNESLVIVSADNYYNIKQIHYLRGLLVAACIIALLFTFLFALFLSKRIFRPIIKITNSVKAISTENLHLRLDVKQPDDELGRLASTFNNMLDRLETSFETQNNFISNASHELRTPLTSIIGQADVMLSKERQPEEYVESLRIIVEEAEKLDRKTRALLFLAQTGFNGKVQEFKPVRMDQLLLDVTETIKKLNPKSRIVIDLELLPDEPKKLKVSGNEQLLHLALSNVIGNACKYSDNRNVYISIGSSDKNVVLVVKDEGIGIPENEICYIYDPFFRASNTSNYEGYGIGLPLTRNIIKIHHGELLVTSIENKGTTVQIKLPILRF